MTTPSVYDTRELAQQLKTAIESYYRTTNIAQEAVINRLCTEQPLNYFKLLRACFESANFISLGNNVNLYSLMKDKLVIKDQLALAIPFPYVGYILANHQESVPISDVSSDMSFTEQQLADWCKAKFAGISFSSEDKEALLHLLYPDPDNTEKAIHKSIRENLSPENRLLLSCFSSRDRLFIKDLFNLHMGQFSASNEMQKIIVDTPFVQQTRVIRQKCINKIFDWYSSNQATDELKQACYDFMQEFAKIDATVGRSEPFQAVDALNFCNAFQNIYDLLPAKSEKPAGHQSSYKSLQLDSVDKEILVTLSVLGIVLAVLCMSIAILTALAFPPLGVATTVLLIIAGATFASAGMAVSTVSSMTLTLDAHQKTKSIKNQPSECELVKQSIVTDFISSATTYTSHFWKPTSTSTATTENTTYNISVC